MRLKHFCLGAMGVAAASLLPVTAQSAPLTGSELKAGAADTSNMSNIEKAAYRRCWWRHGNRVCRWVGYPYSDDGYGYDGSYGYGPGIGFGFRGGGGHFRGGHRR